jgi:hypothetical protein
MRTVYKQSFVIWVFRDKNADVCVFPFKWIAIKFCFLNGILGLDLHHLQRYIWGHFFTHLGFVQETIQVFGVYSSILA